MLSRKASLYAVMLIVLTACTKQDITPNSSSAQSQTVDQLRWWPKSNPNPDPNPNPDSNLETTFGLLEEDATNDETKNDMAEADVNLVRIPIFLSESTVNKTIDDFLNDGYNVQINANWYNDVNGQRTFPTDVDFLKSQAEAFFQYYAPYKDQIPFVAIENEWDYEVQHGASLQDYLTELSIVTTIGHKYGFKISDGGITSGTLQRWTYSQLTGDEQVEWDNDYYVGLNNDYDALLDMVNTYTAGVHTIDIDYSNVHWYNTRSCGNGFATASQTFMDACNKNMVVCNEFGIRTNSVNLYDATVNEIKGNTNYAIAYSGTNAFGKPIKLTKPMLDLLN